MRMDLSMVFEYSNYELLNTKLETHGIKQELPETAS